MRVSGIKAPSGPSLPLSLIRAVCLPLAVAAIGLDRAYAAADGPDVWVVRGIPCGDALAMRAAPSPKAPRIADIPYNARGLGNLGCQGGPTFAQWSEMTPVERKRASRKRWCKIEYAGRQGWVAGRYLAE